jgi:hypothetical protein
MAMPASAQATSFTYFSKLPREIQLSIWEYSLPPPRMIHIFAQPWWFPMTTQSARNLHKHVWLDRSPVPAILHACVDSREVGLKHYELILDTTTKIELSLTPLSRGKKPAYVDLARDILVTKSRFYVGAFLKATPQTVLNRICNFAYSGYCDDAYGSFKYKELMQGLPALDGLALTYDRIRDVETWHKVTVGFFTDLKRKGETLPKIRIFKHLMDLVLAVQNEKFWGAENEVGWLVSQVDNHQLRKFST